MAGENEMFASEFILQGFTTQADLQVVFFVLFLALYVVILPGNLGVIMLIQIDPCLFTPTCFFLSHVSLLDICCSSTIIPRSLRDVLVEKKLISFGHSLCCRAGAAEIPTLGGAALPSLDFSPFLGGMSM
uniref:G-protein coupled receptors family 1 profile domain-containing protein n=1 Tax=Zonotrichia albicollis TaxID=44394 RepID=A0A8D2MMH8_ZONAL